MRKKFGGYRVVSVRRTSKKAKQDAIIIASVLLVAIVVSLLIAILSGNDKTLGGSSSHVTSQTVSNSSIVQSETEVVSSTIAKTEDKIETSSVSSAVQASSTVSSKPSTTTTTSLPTVTSNAVFDVYASAPNWTYTIDKSKPIPLQPAVENYYFNTAMFVGDSLTTGIDLYDVMTNTTVIAKTGINTNTILTSKAIKVSGVKMTFLQAMKRHNPKYIYIMLGSNGIHFQTKSKLISGYSEFIDGVKKQHPNAIIYIQSILPVTAKKQASNSAFANSKINTYNAAILELAAQKGVYYVNVAEALKDANGNLSTSFDGGDGMHLNKKGYIVWIEYLKRHTVFEGTPPTSSTTSRNVSIVRPESSSSSTQENKSENTTTTLSNQ